MTVSDLGGEISAVSEIQNEDERLENKIRGYNNPGLNVLTLHQEENERRIDLQITAPSKLSRIDEEIPPHLGADR